MDSTPTILAHPIQCGKKTCGECNRRDEDYCAVFDTYLVEDAEDVFLRCESCLAAQARADDMMLKTAMAKAEVKPAEAPAVSAEEHGD